MFRKVIVNAPASASSLTYTHYWDHDGIEHIDSNQEMASVASHAILRVPDNQTEERTDDWAGRMTIKCWWGALEDVTEEHAYFRGAWDGVDKNEKLLFSIYASLEHGWTVFEVRALRLICT